MEGYNTEEETLAALRNWWDKNGKYVVAGLVIAALVIGGWRLWGYWQGKRSAGAASLYISLIQAEQQNDNAAVVKAARAVVSAYPDTAYGALAGLALAKSELRQQHLKAAEGALQQVVQHSPDKGLAVIAQLRLARVQIQTGDSKAALTTLQSQGKSGPFAATAEAIRGDAYHALGKPGAARLAYGRALAQASATSGQYQMLKMRLASLPVGASTGAGTNAKSASTTAARPVVAASAPAAAPASARAATSAAIAATSKGTGS